MAKRSTTIVAIALAVAFTACSGAAEVDQPLILDSRYASEAETPEVIALLSHDRAYTRKMAAAELGYNRRDSAAIPALISALGTEANAEVSLRFALVLLNFRDQRAVDAVVEHWLSNRFPQHQSDLLSALYGTDPCLVEPAMHTYGHLDPARPVPVRQACQRLPNE